jgi:hypothetical protein
VTLEALLTFFSILVAVYAIARPVQRQTLSLFVSSWRMGVAMLLSFALIVCRDPPLDCPSRSITFHCLTGQYESIFAIIRSARAITSAIALSDAGDFSHPTLSASEPPG